MNTNNLTHCWAQSSTHEVGMLSVIFRGYSNLQTGSSSLEILEEVQTDAAGSSTEAPTACVLRDPCRLGYRDHLMILPWAQLVSGVPEAQPEESLPPPHSGESD